MSTRAERYLRSAEAARLLHVSPKTVTRWANLGQLKSVRTLGGHRRFPESEILELQERLAKQG